MRAFIQPGSQGPLLTARRVREDPGDKVDIHCPRRMLQFAVEHVLVLGQIEF